MKRLICTLLILLLLPCLALPALASEKSYIADYADLLLPQEEASLQALAQEIHDDFGMDIVILTLASLEGSTPQVFADDYYDHNGYGADGALFLLSMAERDWYISTCGDMIYALTDYGIQAVTSDAISYMSEGEYYDGFRCFLLDVPEYIEAFREGTPIDGHANYAGDYYHGDREETVYYEDSSPNFFLSLVIGLAAGGITVFVMYRMMDEKNRQRNAAAYITDGSFHLNTRRDLFLYSNLSKTRKQQNTSSGGGSSVHRSSGGRSHGGGGGKF